MGTLPRRALGPETEPTAVTSTMNPTKMLLHVSEDQKRGCPFRALITHTSLCYRSPSHP